MEQKRQCSTSCFYSIWCWISGAHDEVAKHGEVTAMERCLLCSWQWIKEIRMVDSLRVYVKNAYGGLLNCTRGSCMSVSFSWWTCQRYLYKTLLLIYHEVFERNAAYNATLVGDRQESPLSMTTKQLLRSWCPYEQHIQWIFVQTARWLLHKRMGKILALTPWVFWEFFRVSFSGSLKLRHQSSQMHMIQSTGLACGSWIYT